MEISKIRGELSVIIITFACKDTRLSVVSPAKLRKKYKGTNALGGGRKEKGKRKEEKEKKIQRVSDRKIKKEKRSSTELHLHVFLSDEFLLLCDLCDRCLCKRAEGSYCEDLKRT